MKNKKFISWGVSFSSLALVAGMISYLGITNNTAGKANTTAQSQVAAQGSIQSSISQSSSQNQSFSSQQGGFDTTTGGS